MNTANWLMAVGVACSMLLVIVGSILRAIHRDVRIVVRDLGDTRERVANIEGRLNRINSDPVQRLRESR